MAPFGLKHDLLYMMSQSGLSVDDLDYGKKKKGREWSKNYILEIMESYGITVEEMEKASRGICNDPEPEPLPMNFKDLMLTVASPEKEVEEDEEENPWKTFTRSDHKGLPPISYDNPDSSDSEAVEVDDDDDDDDDDDYDDISDCEIKTKDGDDFSAFLSLLAAGAAALGEEDKQQMDDGVPSVSNKRPRHVPTPLATTGAAAADKQMDDGVPSFSNKRLRPLPESP